MASRSHIAVWVIFSSDREVLGDALDDPERQRSEVLQPTRLRHRDVVLEPVHDLVAEHVIVLGVEAGERHDDSRAQPFGDAAGTLIDEATDDVRLLEVGVVRVEDDGLLRERVRQPVRESRVPPFGHAGGVGGRQRLRGIPVNVEVVRAKDPEIEGLVLDLVASEVLSRERGGRERGERHSPAPAVRRGAGAR